MFTADPKNALRLYFFFLFLLELLIAYLFCRCWLYFIFNFFPPFSKEYYQMYEIFFSKTPPSWTPSSPTLTVLQGLLHSCILELPSVILLGSILCVSDSGIIHPEKSHMRAKLGLKISLLFSHIWFIIRWNIEFPDDNIRIFLLQASESLILKEGVGGSGENNPQVQS